VSAPPPLLGYTAGGSWLHRASPLPKLAWLVAAFPVVLLTYEPAVLLAGLVTGLLVCVSGGVGRAWLRTVVALAPIGASIVVLQTLAPVACRTGCTAAATLGPVTLYQEGLSHALALVGRLLVLETVAVATLATTHPSDLFSALRRLRLPHEIALMAMLSLQLIPQLQGELRDVLAAQRARGLRASGIRALAPTLVPVVAGAFDRLTTLVLGLEARGVGGPGARTSYRRVRLGRAGVLAVGLAGVAAVAGSWLAATRWGAAEAGTIVLAPPVAVAIVVGAAIIFAVVMTRGLRSLARS
jgi:energy-coupling factor transporter transmembrane protein EcfT